MASSGIRLSAAVVFQKERPLYVVHAFPKGAHLLNPHCPSFPNLGSNKIFYPRLQAATEDSGMMSVLHDQSMIKVPQVLTVAGSDSGAGAGIQADLKACAARGVYCSTVITAVTAQNTIGVQDVSVVREDTVAEQLKSVMSDMKIDVFKSALVVDPVMVSTSGDALVGPSILDDFRFQLLPLADLVTPNLNEASALLGGVKMDTVADMRFAAKSIHNMGPRNVLVKGGDLQDSFDAVDVFFDGVDFYELCSPRINTRNTHGTGCSLASSIAAELAKGSPMLPAIMIAKRFVETALDYSKDIVIGNGSHGPFDHLMKLKKSNIKNSRVFDEGNLLLYAVTDSRLNKKWGRSMTDAVKAVIEGGATIVQLREKEAETRDYLSEAEACIGICRSHGVPLLINDRLDIALACDADGVHVGQSDMPVRAVRSLLGPEKIIGVSCKTPEQARRAWMEGGDYVGCGGVFPTKTKVDNIRVGLDGLRSVCSGSKLPVVAIGGICDSNLGSVMELGAHNLKGFAVVSALFDRECVESAAHGLMTVISSANNRSLSGQ